MAQKKFRRNRKMLRNRIEPKDGIWIIYQLTLKGIKQVDLCQKLGVKPSTMTHVIHGRNRSGRIEEALYKTLGYSSFEAMLIACRSQEGGKP